MTKIIEPGQTIGIIGGGQLGKMLAQSAQEMGYRIAVYDPSPDACAFGVAHETTVGAFDDPEAILAFAKSVDVLTYEFENVSGEILSTLEDETNFPQGSKLLIKSQDRIVEKTWLNDLGIKTVPFAGAESFKEVVSALEDFDYKAIIKTTRFGYDGKGQMKITSKDDLDQSAVEALLSEQALIVEQLSDFDYEASIIVSRNPADQIEIFPMSVNEHAAGVLFKATTTNEIRPELQSQLTDLATKIAHEGELVGVCAIELFITADGDVLVNELAPRPHNSGHQTIEACNVSQFDQHILAVCNRPLAPVKLLTPTMMINILGQHMDKAYELMAEQADIHYHIYGKVGKKRQRKMGHMTLLFDEIDDIKAFEESSTLLDNWEKAYY